MYLFTLSGMSLTITNIGPYCTVIVLRVSVIEVVHLADTLTSIVAIAIFKLTL